MQVPFVSIDIEPTNRCNAKCYFCPRDQTPHQGLMTQETFARSLERALEFRTFSLDALDKDIRVSLCGLGEPLLNKRTPDFVRQVKDAGLECGMASNAALLDEAAGRRLLDAGLDRVSINVGEQGDDYESIYKLPWERTRDNVLRFREMAGDRCEVQVILVNHRRDDEHIEHMREFWSASGIDNTFSFELMNRGGALFVDHMQFEEDDELGAAQQLLAGLEPEAALCHAPFVFLFVGYDGNYYLCCSDWKKEAPVGDVFTSSFVDVAGDKFRHVASREPVCRTCNFDPLNRVAEELRAMRVGTGSQASLDAVVVDLVEDASTVREFLGSAGVDSRVDLGGRTSTRRLIPVRGA
jgi:MoaA/NifB/PqqE/SkfB family radical SAM enzyme